MKERGAGRTEPQVLWHEEKGSLTLEGERAVLRIQDSGDGCGNGFTFQQYNAHDLYEACWRAKEGYWHKDGWPVLVHRAMCCDFSWNVSAHSYIDMYQQVMNLW